MEKRTNNIDMRVNKKKFTIAGIAVLVIWCLIFFYPIEVPRPKLMVNKLITPDVVDFEKRLDNLQNELNLQYSEISKLLATVKQHLKKTSVSKEEEEVRDSLEGGGQAIAAPPPVTVLPVLVIACDRVTVKRCLDNLIKFRPNKNTFPIIVSQDCGHNATYQVIKRYVDADPSITVVKQPDLADIKLPHQKLKFKGYYKIARHYRFALNHVFQTLGHSAVIIVEDDLDISPDFFEYFEGTYPLLLQDPSIWCISAWNDNGKRSLIDRSHPELLYRTDFFPGLGWILRRESWLELEPQWPEAFFDDWLRDPKVTKGKSCIRPEISRTYSFGKLGVSKGLFFEMHLKHLHLNTDFVEFTKLNLSYLLKPNYDVTWAKQVEAALPMQAADVKLLPAAEAEAGEGEGEGERGGSSPVRVTYTDAATFRKAAKKLGLMDDFRSGIPRTAYQGVVTCFINGRRVYLAPGYKWTGYDPKWG